MISGTCRDHSQSGFCTHKLYWRISSHCICSSLRQRTESYA